MAYTSQRAPNEEVAHYSSATGNRYFNWNDAFGLSARELAVLFVERYPAVAADGGGVDWPYACWLTEALGRAEFGGADALPVFFADYPLNVARDALPPRLTSDYRAANAP